MAGYSGMQSLLQFMKKATIHTYPDDAATALRQRTLAPQTHRRRAYRHTRPRGEMTVSGTNARMGMLLSLGVLPDGITRKGLPGEMPIKKKTFPLLDSAYQLRVAIETKNLIVWKCPQNFQGPEDHGC